MYEEIRQQKLICITNRHLVQGDFLDRIRQIAAKKQVDAIILREKDLSEEDYRTLAENVLRICEKYHKHCILHTFWSVAEQLKHPYLHLSYPLFLQLYEQRPEFLERECGQPTFWKIGVSTHTVEEARLAETMGASYVTASHIFPTACKEGLPPRGLSYLREAAGAVEIPVFALGGIHPEHISACMEAGAAGVCMMSEFMCVDLRFCV